MGRVRIAFAGLLVAVSMGSPLPAAHATPDPGFGQLCGFTSLTDPLGEGAQTGEVDGGPLFLSDDTDLLASYSGRLVCTIQVDAPTHAGADACSVTGAVLGNPVFAAGTCTYSYGTGSNVYLCTQVDIDGGPTLYFDDSNDPLTDGSWSTDPWSARCMLATSFSTGDGPAAEEADAVVCPVLATMLPPEGDIAGVWDCPPYDPSAQGPDGGGNGNGHGGRKPKPDGHPSLVHPGGGGGGGGEPLPAPLYPTGVIEITGAPDGSVQFSYTGFSPSLGQWVCTPDDTAAATSCTPPPAPQGYRNVCSRPTVAVTNRSAGTVGGSSHCGGAGGETTSTGPTTTPSTAAGGDGDFPWVCAGAPAQPTPGFWTVRCTVGQ